MTDATAGEVKERKNGLWKRVVRVLRGLDGDATAEAIADELRKREDEGEPIAGAQRDMLLKAARFDQLLVGDVMKPRAHIVAVEASATLAEVAMLFAESQHSRLPIYRDTLDDPLGFVHVKEVLALLAPTAQGAATAKPTDRVLMRIKRDVLYVPSSMRLPNLLLKMRTTRSHLALVVDEYGGTDGLVTIEDLVEQIVGAIDDEHDTEEAPLIQQRPGGVFEVDGRADVESVEKAIGLSLALPEEGDDFDTAAGLAVALVGRVPQRGEVLRHPGGVDIEVLDADPRRVKRLRVRPAAAAGAEPGA
ncbi:MAG: hemolysin family protein [Caulobacterales bacterium]|jgi:CBS domain containing-hemolysin-like protein